MLGASRRRGRVFAGLGSRRRSDAGLYRGIQIKVRNRRLRRSLVELQCVFGPVQTLQADASCRHLRHQRLPLCRIGLNQTLQLAQGPIIAFPLFEYSTKLKPCRDGQFLAARIQEVFIILPRCIGILCLQVKLAGLRRRLVIWRQFVSAPVDLPPADSRHPSNSA